MLFEKLCTFCSPIVSAFLIMTSSVNVEAQTDNTIFTVRKASLNKDVLEYSPLRLGDQWVYTQQENEAVIMSSLGSDKMTPISGFNLRKSNVTGFAKANNGGLIAISYGDKKTNVPAKLKNNKIYFAFEDKSGFASKYFEFALNNENYSCTTPFISPDGTKLYFASDKPGGYGGFDLYVCDYRGKEWSKPRNLGPVINTDKDEVYPYMVDNILFFSSNGHGGARMDIFIADMGNDRGRLVINAGSPINSPADDYSMTFDNNSRTGYFLSDRDGVNGKAFEVTNEKKLLLINIRSNDDKKAISGTKLDLSRCKKNPMYANSKGSIILPVPPGEKCFVQIGKVGYNATTMMIDYNEITGLKKAVDIYLSEEGVFYKGQVTDQSGNPAIEVELAIIDQATGELQYVFTDEEGRYSAALEPLSFYLIRSKSAYFDTKETKIATQASVPSTILGTIQLQSNGIKQSSILPTSSMDDIKVVAKTEISNNSSNSNSVSDFVEVEATKKIESAKGPETSITDAQRMMDENDKISSKPRADDVYINSDVKPISPNKPIITSNGNPAIPKDNQSKPENDPVNEEKKPVTEPKATTPSAPVIIEMPKEEPKANTADKTKFAIQLAAISTSAKNSNLNPYMEKTKGMGKVYTVNEGNMMKVRLGFFETRADAIAMRDKLPVDLQKGFIVELKESEIAGLMKFDLNEGSSVNIQMPKNNTSTTPQSTIQPDEPKTVLSPQSTSTGRAEFKIRLSTLRDPKLFNGSNVKQYGLVEEVKNGNLTTFYLSGFESKEEAVESIEKVKAAGFPAAQIVKLQNGEYSLDNN